MAISFTVSYTFSPNTTIQSSQVNTNFSDNANVWTGLEALTKTFAKLKVDVDPATALEVATKQYVDHYSAYRRPVLQYSSGTVVNMETGINGTSGQAQILFPDGNLRTDSTSTRINCNFAQVAALSGTAQSGLRTGSQTANTWYAIYAVKTTDNTSNFVAVADTTLPTQANYATLNSNFGTNGWVYLGLVRNGNGLSANNTIIEFYQVGNMTIFENAFTGQNTSSTLPGWQIATSAAATTLAWTYAAGTSGAVLPNNITAAIFTGATGGLASQFVHLEDNANNGRRLLIPTSASANSTLSVMLPTATNRGAELVVTGATNVTMDLAVSSFWDGVLGVGSNPIL